ncbi:MAG: hypothetical protein ACRDJ9_22955 [Dehalococcoidia bacterium]
MTGAAHARRGRIAMAAATLLLAVAATGCTGEPESRATPSPGRILPAESKWHVGRTCEHLVEHSWLGGVVDKGEYSDATRGENNSEACTLDYARVAKPVPGALLVAVTVHQLFASDNAEAAKKITDQREEFSEGAEKLPSCGHRAECWLRDVTSGCTATSDDEYGRDVGVRAISLPYTVEIRLGLWPKDGKHLCTADSWSKERAIALLGATLTYLHSR